MAGLAQLIIDLSVNSAKFVSGINQANKTLTGFKQSIEVIKFDAIVRLGEKAIGAANQIYQLADAGAKLMQIEEVFSKVTTSFGINAEKLISDLDEIARHTIDDSELMKTASKSMFQGFSEDEIRTMMQDAVTLARIMGTDIGTAYQELSSGIETLRVRQLKGLGIVIDQERAYRDFAKSINIAKDALTEEGKKHALLAIEHEKTMAMAKALGDTMDNASIKLQQFKAAAVDVWEGFQKGMTNASLVVLGAADVIMGAYNMLIASAQKWISSFLDIVSQGMKALHLPGAEAVGGAAEFLKKSALEDWNKSLEQFKSAYENIKLIFMGGAQKGTGKIPGIGSPKGYADQQKAAELATQALQKYLETELKMVQEGVKWVEQQAYSAEFQQVLLGLWKQEDSIREKLLKNKFAEIDVSDKLTSGEKERQKTIEGSIAAQEAANRGIERKIKLLQWSIEMWSKEEKAAWEAYMEETKLFGAAGLGIEPALRKRSEFLKLLTDYAEQEKEAMAGPISPIYTPGFSDEELRQGFKQAQEQLRSVQQIELEASKAAAQLTGNWKEMKNAELDLLKIERDRLLNMDNLEASQKKAINTQYELQKARLQAEQSMDKFALAQQGILDAQIRVNKELVDAYRNVIPNAIETTVDAFSTMMDGLTDKTKKKTDVIKQFFLDMGKGIQKIFTDIGKKELEQSMLKLVAPQAAKGMEIKSLASQTIPLSKMDLPLPVTVTNLPTGFGNVPQTNSTVGNIPGLTGTWEGGIPANFGEDVVNKNEQMNTELLGTIERRYLNETSFIKKIGIEIGNVFGSIRKWVADLFSSAPEKITLPTTTPDNLSTLPKVPEQGTPEYYKGIFLPEMEAMRDESERLNQDMIGPMEERYSQETSLIKKMGSGIANVFSSIWKAIESGASEVIKFLSNAFSSIVGSSGRGGSGFMGLLSSIFGGGGGGAGAGASGFEALTPEIASAAGIIHGGGPVEDNLITLHGGGSSLGKVKSDEVITKLLKKEYVIKPEAVLSVGEKNLDYINSTGKLPTDRRDGFPKIDKITEETKSIVKTKTNEYLTQINRSNITEINAIKKFETGMETVFDKISKTTRNDTFNTTNLQFKTIKAFADGGIISQPTHALMGEAGPEAVIPLKNGKIPVESRGGMSRGNNTYVFISAIDTQSFAEAQRKAGATVIIVDEHLQNGGPTGQLLQTIRSSI